MTTLKIGDKAPAIEAKNQDGEHVSLSSLKGNKVVLYFYPKDSTPGCTAEACDLRDNYHQLMKAGYKVLGVSPDTEKSHRKFIDKYELPFDLIADTELKVLQDYGVWGEKKMYGRSHMGVMRTTFIIDANGIIEDIIEKVDTKNHTSQILK